MRTDTPTLLRWTARVLGALIVLFWGWFLLADLFGDQGTTRPLVPGDYGILATLLLSLAGLVVAWKHELAGGIVALAGLALCAILNWRVLVFPGTLILVAALLFIACGWIDRTRTRTRTPALGGRTS